jgi:hypothetical protein
MFAGTLTKNAETAATVYSGMIHSNRFDIAIQLETRNKISDRSPDFDVTVVDKSGRVLSSFDAFLHKALDSLCSRDLDEDTPLSYLDRVCFEIIIDRRRKRLSAANVKTTAMQRAFDHAVDYQTIFKTLFLVGAHQARRKEAFVCIVDGDLVAFMLPGNQVLFVNVVGGASVNPLAHRIGSCISVLCSANLLRRDNMTE